MAKKNLIAAIEAHKSLMTKILENTNAVIIRFRKGDNADTVMDIINSEEVVIITTSIETSELMLSYDNIVGVIGSILEETNTTKFAIKVAVKNALDIITRDRFVLCVGSDEKDIQLIAKTEFNLVRSGQDNPVIDQAPETNIVDEAPKQEDAEQPPVEVTPKKATTRKRTNNTTKQ